MPKEFPFECELCHDQITSDDDQIFWHGYGNCVEITDEMWEQWWKESEDASGNQSD